MNRALRLFSVHLHVVYTTRFFVLRFRFIELVRLASVKAIVNIQSQLPAFNHINYIIMIYEINHRPVKLRSLWLCFRGGWHCQGKCSQRVDAIS